MCKKLGPPGKLLDHCKLVDLPMNKDLRDAPVDVFAVGGGD